MKTFSEQVAEFHNMFGHPVKEKPGFPEPEREELRMSLLAEEFAELARAMGYDITLDMRGPRIDNRKRHLIFIDRGPDKCLSEVADAICDLHVVLSGTSLEYGLPENKLFAEVHRSNMSKAEEDGTVIKREDGKIMKSSSWSPPNIAKILEEV